MVKGTFWAITDEMPLGASIPFESGDEENHHIYEILFVDQPKGMGAVNPCSVIRIRSKKAEFLWSDLRTKDPDNQSQDAWY